MNNVAGIDVSKGKSIPFKGRHGIFRACPISMRLRPFALLGRAYSKTLLNLERIFRLR